MTVGSFATIMHSEPATRPSHRAAVASLRNGRPRRAAAAHGGGCSRPCAIAARALGAARRWPNDAKPCVRERLITHLQRHFKATVLNGMPEAMRDPSQTDSGGARGRVFAQVPTTIEEGYELVFESSVPARGQIGFGDHHHLHPTTSSITPARSDTHCMASLISGASRPLCPVVDSSSLAVFSGVFTNKPGSPP